MIGENTLISRDSKGKIRVVEINYQWEDNYNGFVIRRHTYQYGGKITNILKTLCAHGQCQLLKHQFPRVCCKGQMRRVPCPPHRSVA